MDYQKGETRVEGDFIPDERHVSYPETVHGGLLEALLDDAMAYVVNQRRGWWLIQEKWKSDSENRRK